MTKEYRVVLPNGKINSRHASLGEALKSSQKEPGSIVTTYVSLKR